MRSPIASCLINCHIRHLLYILLQNPNDRVVQLALLLYTSVQCHLYTCVVCSYGASCSCVNSCIKLSCIWNDSWMAGLLVHTYLYSTAKGATFAIETLTPILTSQSILCNEIHTLIHNLIHSVCDPPYMAVPLPLQWACQGVWNLPVFYKHTTYLQSMWSWNTSCIIYLVWSVSHRPAWACLMLLWKQWRRISRELHGAF